MTQPRRRQKVEKRRKFCYGERFRYGLRVTASATADSAESRQPVNRTLYHCDNLDVLRGINSATIDLIATDPPFNKSRDFHATPDSLAKGARFEDRWSWDRDVHPDWVDAVKDDWEGVWSVIEASRIAAGEDMAAFLCWLGVRLMECHRVLKDTGSLYLHIDHTAHAYAKCLLDGIFGRANFRNELVWCYPPGGKAPKFGYHRKHDTLLYYGKTDKGVFNHPYGDMPPQTVATYNKVDEDGRLYKEYPGGRQYLDQTPGRPIPDWWDDIVSLGQAVSSKERTGYPTQKPLALYERIIRASSNPGDMVLDPFAGCATTPVAAERQGRQWIGIDIWDGAYQMVLDRLEQENLKVGDDASKRLNFGEVYLRTTPPERTDYDEARLVPDLRLRTQRPPEPWEKLSREDMARILAAAQAHPNGEGVICAGCGRVLEMEFMELDHITPKSDRGANHILNRILLCRPCNGRKRNHLTLAGLLMENKRPAIKWMRNETQAQLARDNAEKRANWVRDNFGNGEYQAFVAGL